MITVTSNHRCVFELYVLHKHETVSATDLCLLLRFQTLITVPIIMYFCISIVKSRDIWVPIITKYCTKCTKSTVTQVKPQITASNRTSKFLVNFNHRKHYQHYYRHIKLTTTIFIVYIMFLSEKTRF